MKGLNAGMTRMILVVVGVLALGYILFKYTNTSSYLPVEGMANMAPPAGGAGEAAATHAAPGSVGGTMALAPGGELKPSEMVPSSGLGSAWAATNPSGLGDMKNQNFLSSGHLIGVNTVGQSKRNATHDIRVEYPNPRQAVSPWSNSVIEGPDAYRRGLGDVGTPQ
jgi:hypothetical protein